MSCLPEISFHRFSFRTRFENQLDDLLNADVSLSNGCLVQQRHVARFHVDVANAARTVQVFNDGEAFVTILCDRVFQRVSLVSARHAGFCARVNQ